MREVIVEPQAQRELREIWDYIASENRAAATRVVGAIYDSFDVLAQYPQMGRRRATSEPGLQDIRAWPVSRFNRYVIFYRATERGIQIIHVYHEARDISVLLGEETPA